ncbi:MULTISPECIES: hypothetical protein [unclassified Siphonobacter]|uniref:hypothetical protein n=1 Tax=unclassified Siphonobacter TaxID=2635712 RepID=UPI000CB96E44|nr:MULTISPECIES: hypothetical protein [unclassified Siphonobacter]MDQ1090401.1 hypothetical protein [Siphonobacter sp. SORGH_AS_1065]MDR6197897.1 hypothetical protein [Siphonobacter sp. SORGH_AS_0500]PKK37197.1 hypothetical protein BWI96_07560 [Siphonobacter sp. SORGH_AS_0500]
MAKKDFMNLMKEKTTNLKPSILSSEEHIKSQITILQELKELIPPLTPDELQQLEQNILKHGVKDPVTIWETTTSIAGIDEQSLPVYILIDGHNRFSIVQTHHLDFRINLVHFGSMAEVKDYMIDHQLGRRNLTPEQASYLRGLRYLQQKNVRGGNQYSPEQENISVNLGKEYGVSSRTIKRDGDFAAGLEKLTTEFKSDILSGKQKLPKASINAISKVKTKQLFNTPEEVQNAISASPFSEDVTERRQLQLEIKTLASGPLTKEICETLVQRIQQFQNLLQPK